MSEKVRIVHTKTGNEKEITAASYEHLFGKNNEWKGWMPADLAGNAGSSQATFMPPEVRAIQDIVTGKTDEVKVIKDDTNVQAEEKISPNVAAPKEIVHEVKFNPNDRGESTVAKRPAKAETVKPVAKAPAKPAKK